VNFHNELRREKIFQKVVDKFIRRGLCLLRERSMSVLEGVIEYFCKIKVLKETSAKDSKEYHLSSL